MNKQENYPKMAWGGSSSVEDSTDLQCSFRDLMSKDLAEDLQKKEDSMFLKSLETEPKEDIIYTENTSDNDTSNDLLLAYMLQDDFNREHDNEIQREENHFNKNSKVNVSLINYKIGPVLTSEEFPDIDEDNRDLDSFEKRERDDPVIPACGYIKHNNKMITKHDRNITGRKNAQRVMSFPPEINTGDGGGFDMEISNPVYSKLSHSVKSEAKRKNRIKDKTDKSTTDKAMDQETKLVVYKMINNLILHQVDGVVSSGKESIVFHAEGGALKDVPLPDELAIKVFKTTLTDFKTRERYIKKDFRFKDRYSKSNSKQVIQLWAEKEFHNLKRLQKASIAAPVPFMIKKHVLLMSFIGKDSIAAEKLKVVNLSFVDWCIAYEQVLEIMLKMYKECKLVHGDFSEYNILWHDNQCFVIDVSQAVEPTHPQAFSFLLRDCSNIVKFFKSKGISDVLTALELFKKLTGIDLPKREGGTDEDIVEEYQSNQELWKEELKSTDNDHFEYFWEESKNSSRQNYEKKSIGPKEEEENCE